jgi:PAS domain S-box-containing protein
MDRVAMGSAGQGAREAQRVDELRALHRRVAELEARLAERELGQQRFRDLTHSLVDWFWEVDREGRYTYASGRVFDLLGYTPEEVLGKRPFELLDPSDADAVEKQFSELSARGAPIVDLINWNVGKQGQRVCLLTNGVPIVDDDGGLVGYRGVDKDITATQLDAEQLALSEQRLRDVLDTLPDVLLIVDEDGVYLEAHTAQQGLLYKQVEQLRGKHIEELHPPERAALFMGVVRDAISSGELKRIEYELDVPLGRRWFEGRCLRVGREIQGKRAAVFVARDITDRKVAELELARSNRDLGQFASIASHDLREPLRTVAGHLGLLERRLGEHLDSDTKELLNAAVDGAVRMNRLVGDLLAFSRVGADDTPLAPVDLGEVYEQVLVSLAAVIAESEATIEAGALPRVFGLEPQLTQLLQNLLQNALKFRGEAPPRVRVSAEAQGDQWVVRVRDNGPGIEPEQQERIFGAFVRAPSRRRQPGSGIGLAICRKIVERHGGRIWVDARPGEGACFTFTLRTPPEPGA